MADEVLEYEQVYHFGFPTEDDLVLEAWRTEFVRHTGDSDELTDPGDLLMQGDRAIVLICLAASMRGALLRRIVQTRIDKVLYLPTGGRDLAPHVAIEYCKSKGVLDVISGDQASKTWRTNRLDPFVMRLRNLCRRQSLLYDPLKLGDSVRLDPKRDLFFLATPFAKELADCFEEGSTAALRGLGFQVYNPRTEWEMSQKITDKIQNMIRSSRVVLANMRHSAIQGFNPNVFYEMGFAQGSDRLVLPFRHISDAPAVPVDVRDRPYIPYEDAVDIAMKLYWGLKGSLTDAATFSSI